MTARQERNAAEMRQRMTGVVVETKTPLRRQLKRETTITPKEFSELCGYSVSTVIRLIQYDPAVHKHQALIPNRNPKKNPSGQDRKLKTTYKIPESHAVVLLERLKHNGL